jgi:hypothetical protein
MVWENITPMSARRPWPLDHRRGERAIGFDWGLVGPGEGVEATADAPPEAIDGALVGFSEKCLQFCEDLLSPPKDRSD